MADEFDPNAQMGINPYFSGQLTDPGAGAATWGDFVKSTVGVGGAALASIPLGAARWVGDQTGNELLSAGSQYLLTKVGRFGEDSLEAMSPGGQEALTAEIGSEAFWRQPFSSVALKLTATAPTVAAIVGATVFTGGGAAGLTTLGGLSGAASAGGWLAERYNELNAASDQELQDQSDLYRGLRASGMSEEDARKEFTKTLMDARPAMLFALGAITGVVGPEGQIARAVTGTTARTAESGIVRRATTGAAIGGGAEAIQSGAEQLATEDARVSTGQQGDVNWGNVGSAALEGAVLGGVLGGVAGSFGGRRRGDETPPPGNRPGNNPPGPTIPPGPEVPGATPTPIDVVPPAAPNAAEAAAIAASTSPQKPPAGGPPPGAPPAQGTTTPSQGVAPGAASPPPQVQSVAAPAPPTPSATPQGTTAASATPMGPKAAAVVNRTRRPRAAKPAPEPAVTPEVTTPPEPQTVQVTEAPSVQTPPAPIPPQSRAAAATPADDVIPTPFGPARREPRVLEDLSPRAEESRRIAQEQNERIRSNTRQIQKEEAAAERTPRTFSSKAKAEKNARDTQEAGRLVAKHTPQETPPLPRTTEEKQALRARLEALEAEVEEAGINVPRHITKTTTGPLAYLREAADLLRAFRKPKGASNEHIATFLAREAAARAGDYEFIRQGRLEEGELAKRVSQGDVELRAAPAEAADTGTSAGATPDESISDEIADAGGDASIVGNDDVQTRTPPSSRKGVRGLDEYSETAEVITRTGKTVEIERAHAAGSARQIEITDEIRRQYETQGNKPTPAEAKTPDAKLTPKVAAAKGKAEKLAKAKAEPKPAPSHEATSENKPRTTKQRVATAAKETDRNPTEAQKRAGNYEKGKFSWRGLTIAIENPRGSERSGIGPDGKPWRVKMPDHYGYIQRTEGADGDHVDVYVGPDPDNATDVFVIDQVDPDTRAFDEHKVLIGYPDRTSAINAYDRAFSDGRGVERIGDITTMSVDEFKTWLGEGNTKRPAGDTGRATTAEVDDAPLPGPPPDQPLPHIAGTAPGPKSIYDVTPLQSGFGGDMLARVDEAIGKINGGTSEKLLPFFLRRLKELVSDTPVHIVDDAHMELIFPDSTEGTPVGAYMPATGDIYIAATEAADSHRFAHTLLHELTHAASHRALTKDKKMRVLVEDMMSETRAFLLQNQPAGISLRSVDYGFKNTHEFISEAFSNRHFQELLAATPLSDALARRLGLAKTQRFSVWDALIDTVRKMLGMLPGHYSMLEASIRIGEQLTAPRRAELRRQGSFRHIGPNDPLALRSDALARRVTDTVLNLVDRVTDRPALQDQARPPRLLKLQTFDQIAQSAKRYFGGNNPIRRIADTLEMIRTKAASNFRAAEPIVSKLYNLERKYKGAQWDEFTSLVHDETMAGVFADRPLSVQKHLGKDTLDGAWPKAQHADLSARYDALPDDLKAARREAMEFFTNRQNEMSLGLIKNRLRQALGIEDEGLVQRIFDGELTAADRAAIDPHTLELVEAAGALSKIDGPYFPLMRRGEFVVRGRYKIKPPTNALRQLDDNTWEFTNRKVALDWGRQQGTRPTIRSVWVDKNTGERFFTDPNGEQIPVHPNDVDAEQRFRVTVQDRHVEMFDTEREALAAAKELEGNASMASVEGVVRRRFEGGDRQADMLSHQMQTLVQGLERREGYQGMTPAQKNELIQALNEASIRFLGATRIQSRRLPRKYVEGASRDFTRNTLDYAKSSSGYLAKLQHQPALDAALKDMHDQVDASDYGKNTQLGRSAIAHEVDARLASNNGFQEGGKHAPIVNRLMSLSFLDKLFGPSYSIINATQPWLVTFPVLSARYGLGKSFRALGRAYDDVGGLTAVRRGIRNTLRKVRSQEAEADDLIGDIKSRLSQREQQMIDYLSERGAIDPDAGLEIDALIRSRQGVGGRLDQGIGYLDGIARQMPRAIEAINRTATALAAYRLELGRHGDHQRAMEYAQEAVNNTQFNYSTTNAPAMFNHPVARVALQFKKYGQGMYWLLGHQVGKAIRNAEPGDRAEALKALTGLLIAHAAVAGALGLPTEPLKFALLGAKAVGLTDQGWEDIEAKWREVIAGAVGPDLGEVLSRGIPRSFGIDLSSRMGLDSLLTFGEPRGNTEDSNWAWAAKTVAGAPAGMVGDWISGFGALTSGDFTKAAEKLVPIKTFSDTVRAARMATEGKVSAYGNQTMEPYSVGEAVTRAIGFTPARDAEGFERQAAFYSAQQRGNDERSQLMRDWADTSPSERMKIWGRVEAYNRGRTGAERLTRVDLQNYAKRRTKESQAARNAGGLRATRRDQAILDRVNQTYGVVR